MHFSTGENPEESRSPDPFSKGRFVFCLLVVWFATLTAGCTGLSPAVVIPSTLPEVLPGILQGYLALQEAPDSDALLPKPPSSGSAAFAADQERYQNTRGLKNTPRWDLAIKDANLEFPDAASHFSCAVSVEISQSATPHTYMLLRRTLADAGYATYAAKKHYKRPRPFIVNGQASCKPADEPHLRHDGSYPSGHTAIGWTWALILAELVPDHADAVFQRGYAFGQSRVICGVHWQSDVDAGRIIAAAVVAKLHTDAVFRAELEVAKKELAMARADGLKPAGDCKGQNAALAYDKQF